jgi:hypothetical protein
VCLGRSPKEKNNRSKEMNKERGPEKVCFVKLERWEVVKETMAQVANGRKCWP